jgi:hypothetical protein
MSTRMPGLFISLASLCWLGCQGSHSPTGDADAITLPAACRAAPGPALHAVTFNVHNDGARTVFLAIDYACGVTASITGAGSQQDLLGHGGLICPCNGDCPVGGAGCGPGGKAMAPGGRETLSWQPNMVVQATRNGEACACNTRNLPAGRYHFSARVYASEKDATTGDPALLTIDRDFDLPAPADTVDVPFTPPAM